MVSATFGPARRGAAVDDFVSLKQKSLDELFFFFVAKADPIDRACEDPQVRTFSPWGGGGVRIIFHRFGQRFLDTTPHTPRADCNPYRVKLKG